MRIYSLGSVNIDYVYQVEHFVRPGETLSSSAMEVFPGGKGLNQSVALGRAGAQVIHGALLGSDGQFLLETLAASGVDVSRIERRNSPSGHAIIQVDRKGQNCILLFAGTNHQIDRAYMEHFLADAREGDILLLQNEISGLSDAFAIAGEKKLRIAFNPSPFREDILSLPLEQVCWWFCNELEGEALFGKHIREDHLRRYPDSHLILTLGGQGSVFSDADTFLQQPIFPVPVVDTTGAGDTFTGYFLAAVARGEDAASAMQAAARAASITVSRPGAASAIPRREEVYGA